MQEKRIVGLRVADQPVHGAQDVLLGGLQHWVGLIVRQDHHVLALVPVKLHQKARDVPRVVDAALELRVGAKVVDADQQRLAPPGTGTVLERVALRRAMAKLLCPLRRGWCVRSRSVAALVILLLRRLVLVLRRVTVALLGRVVMLWWSLIITIALLLRRSPLLLRRPLVVPPAAAAAARTVALAWIRHV